MGASPQRVVIQRLTGTPGIRERFYVQPGRRYGRWIWFDPEKAPAFEEPQAEFEIERRGGRWVLLKPSS